MQTWFVLVFIGSPGPQNTDLLPHCQRLMKQQMRVSWSYTVQNPPDKRAAGFWQPAECSQLLVAVNHVVATLQSLSLSAPTSCLTPPHPVDNCFFFFYPLPIDLAADVSSLASNDKATAKSCVFWAAISVPTGAKIKQQTDETWWRTYQLLSVSNNCLRQHKWERLKVSARVTGDAQVVHFQADMSHPKHTRRSVWQETTGLVLDRQNCFLVVTDRCAWRRQSSSSMWFSLSTVLPVFKLWEQ